MQKLFTLETMTDQLQVLMHFDPYMQPDELSACMQQYYNNIIRLPSGYAHIFTQMNYDYMAEGRLPRWEISYKSKEYMDNIAKIRALKTNLPTPMFEIIEHACCLDMMPTDEWKYTEYSAKRLVAHHETVLREHVAAITGMATYVCKRLDELEHANEILFQALVDQLAKTKEDTVNNMNETNHLYELQQTMLMRMDEENIRVRGMLCELSKKHTIFEMMLNSANIMFCSVLVLIIYNL